MIKSEECTKARKEKAGAKNNSLVVRDGVDMEAEEGPAGYHVHGHSGHGGEDDERNGMIQSSIFNSYLNQFITFARWDSGMTWLLREKSFR